MPREFQQDGEVFFGGFNSFPNSAAFDANKGILESVINMRIDAGVMRPRGGCVKVADPLLNDCAYAASSHGVEDYIHIFSVGGQVKSLCTTNPYVTPTTQPTPPRPYIKCSGQGYATLGSIEAANAQYWNGAYDFTTCCNVVGRMAYAKGDQIWFSLFGGIQPFDPDTVSLTLGTYDDILKLHYSNATRKLYAFGASSVYEIEPAITAAALSEGKPNEAFFTKVRLLSAQEGIAAPDTVGETNGAIMWLDNGGLNKIDLGKGMIEGELPITLQVNDIFGGRGSTELANCTAIGVQGRYYIAYPQVGETTNTRVLVVNTALGGLFESIDVYPFAIKHLLKARDATGLLRVFAVTPNGTVYRLDDGDTDAGTAITASFRTRDYNFRTDLDKRYDAVTMKMDTKGSANVEMRFLTVNPDSSTPIDRINGNLGTTVRRALAGKKSIGAKIEVVVSAGRPHFYSVSVDATIAGRSIFSVF
jgi:hypothetical protein